MKGRPSSFTQEIGDEICERLSNGESLRKICSDEHMPNKATVFRWLDSEGMKNFSDQYTRARESQADHHVDEIVQIADEEDDPQKARVRIDARKWVAGKQRPKKYGDKATLQHEGNLTINRVMGLGSPDGDDS